MKSKFFTIVAIMFITFIAKGQDLFIIGDKSYPCTSPILLVSNSDDDYDLHVYVCKNGKSGIIGLSKESSLPEEFTGKLNIYLVDGSVIICNERIATERVDDDSKALFSLTDDQLAKLKASNIHTVKYAMTWLSELTYSASNKGIETREIISEFFSPTEKRNTSAETANIPIDPAFSQDLEDEQPFAYVEQMPTFPDGNEAMYKFIYDKLQYPAIARENGISGQVIVQFVVSKNGNITNPRVVRGIGGGCNEEALRIVNAMPNWNPGKHNGRNVAVTFTLPINFALQ